MKGNVENYSCDYGSRPGIYNAVGVSAYKIWGRPRGLRVVMKDYQGQLWRDSAFGHLCSQCFSACGASVRSEHIELAVVPPCHIQPYVIGVIILGRL